MQVDDTIVSSCEVINLKRNALIAYMRLLREVEDAKDRAKARAFAADCFRGVARQYALDLSDG